MLRSQMQIKVAQTKRSAASINSESKLKTVAYCNSRLVAHQTTAYYIITSQPLRILWQH